MKDNDIGYSDLQADVEKKQLKNLRDAVALFKRTAHYPAEARFRWNSEIMWSVDSYFSTATAEEKREFIEAVQGGGIGLNGFYTNQLTGICRPEDHSPDRCSTQDRPRVRRKRQGCDDQ